MYKHTHTHAREHTHRLKMEINPLRSRLGILTLGARGQHRQYFIPQRDCPAEELNSSNGSSSQSLAQGP